ncbi:sugar transferase [Pseudomonas sp. PS1]|uniref:Sugar transferase n=1 Tax=Stutzerimonas marianensis TaxID=2929513 RepID=A0A9X1W072_9GAMM|nr:sugar transferase [Pseudomonas marianensis]
MKRVMDILVSMFVLLFLAPLLAAIALLIRLKLGGPVLFRQIRPGMHGRKFEMIKFRTMLDLTDQYGNYLSDADRLTSLGKALRASSLDELPEFWNVLKGDMSLIGPRPLLMEYLDLYTPEQRRRHNVRPGISGWAQVNGRNSLSWEEKFKLDVWYVDNQSIWLDLKIIFLTIKKVFLREGINAENEATMSKFRGSGKGNQGG